jgi:hypothetical protein
LAAMAGEDREDALETVRRHEHRVRKDSEVAVDIRLR